jgi:hypothetical protein
LSCRANASSASHSHLKAVTWKALAALCNQHMWQIFLLQHELSHNMNYRQALRLFHCWLLNTIKGLFGSLKHLFIIFMLLIASIICCRQTNTEIRHSVVKCGIHAWLFAHYSWCQLWVLQRRIIEVKECTYCSVDDSYFFQNTWKSTSNTELGCCPVFTRKTSGLSLCQEMVYRGLNISWFSIVLSYNSCYSHVKEVNVISLYILSHLWFKISLAFDSI